MSRDEWSTLSSERPTRRALLLGLTGLGLAGCGFRPLYAPNMAGHGGAVSAELAAVKVGLVPDRNGQLLRRALERRLNPSGTGTAPRYDLTLSLTLNSEQQGFSRDGVASRIRYVALAPWNLVTRDTPPKTVASGTERAFDAFNIPDNQFFASDMSREAMERRLVEAVADQLVQRLATRLALPPAA
jgi:LPS-assembly lipoprotein